MDQSLNYGDGSSDLNCGFCPYTFRNRKALIQHIQGHVEFSEQTHMHSLWCKLCTSVVQEQLRNQYPLQIATYSGPGFINPEGLYIPYRAVCQPYTCNGMTYYFYSNSLEFDPHNYPYDSGYYNNDFYDGYFPLSDVNGFIYPVTENYSNASNDQLNMVTISNFIDQPSTRADVELVSNTEPPTNMCKDKTASLKTSNSDFSNGVDDKSEAENKSPDNSGQIFQMTLNRVLNEDMSPEKALACPCNVTESSVNTEGESKLQNISNGDLVLDVEHLPKTPVKSPVEGIAENPRFTSSARNSPMEYISENSGFAFSAEDSPVNHITNNTKFDSIVILSPVEYKSKNSSFASSVENYPLEYISPLKNCSEKLNSQTQEENTSNCDPSFALNARSHPDSPEAEIICLETEVENSKKTLNDIHVENISNENSSFVSNVEKSPKTYDIIECINLESSSEEKLEISNVKDSSLVIPCEVESVSNVEHYQSDLDKTFTVDAPDTENHPESCVESNDGHAWKDVTNRTRRSFNGKLKPAFINGSVSKKGNYVNSRRRPSHPSSNNSIGANTNKNCADQTNSSTSYRKSLFHKNGPKIEIECDNTSNASPSYKNRDKLSYSEVVKFGKGANVRGS